MIAGLLYLALFLIAAGMARHGPALLAPLWTQENGRRAAVAGWSLLLLSLILVFGGSGWPLRLIEWLGLVPALAGAVLLGLAFAPWLPRLGALAAIGAIGLGMLA